MQSLAARLRHHAGYLLRHRRHAKHRPAQRLLGLDWSGWMVHDGWSVYDRFTQAIHQQCNTHLLNRCRELLEVAQGGAARFPLALKALVQKGLATRDRHEQGMISAHGRWTAAGRLTAQLDRLTRGRLTHPGNRRLARFVAKHLQETFAYLWVIVHTLE